MAARQFAYLSMPCTYFSKGPQDVRIVTFRGFPCSLFSFSSAPVSSPSALFICLDSPANQIISFSVKADHLSELYAATLVDNLAVHIC